VRRSDIPDALVIELARARRAGSGGGVIDALTARGIPCRLALAKVEHMVERGLLNYGVSPNQAWPEEGAIRRAGIETL
jgi:hypothetical protein